MDDLSEIHLDFDGKIGLLEELYDSTLDHEFTDHELNVDTNVSRPSSTMSFASWSFSPIAQESSEIKDEVLTDSENSVEHQKTQQTSPQQGGSSCKHVISETSSSDPQDKQAGHVTQNKLTMNVMNFKQPVNQHIVNQPVCISVPSQPMNNVVGNQYPHVIQQQNNPACEFVYPNTLTYHHSVNIHNYVGGQVWRPDCVIERPVICTSPPLQHRDTQQQLKIEFTDPLANLNATGLELARCSTPEYLMALNSLNHPDSPPKPNHSSALNFNCSMLDDSVIDKSMNNVRHDSGYISDMTESPVIRLHDGKVKFTHGKQTSTPQQPPPVLRMTNLPNFNKEQSVPMHHHHHFQSSHSMPVFNPRPQLNESNQMNPFFHPGSYLQSTLQKPKIEVKPPSKIKTEQSYKNMADFQMSKKVKSGPVKRKIEPETENKSDNKRRRHNEPLNNKALQVLNEWYDRNSENPYPNRVEKEDIAKRGGLSVAQVKSWFANKRNRSHNTRPKKQKKEMEGRLLDICHQLARDASKPNKDNAYYIQQLSSIMETTKYI